ncbi:uncharacterized protein FSUBG_7511 [Fusarium subglutinans]|uniref:Uncharacterized protein n=1 Tax=Gibberella subglutinans TaxID=42677 RepID=A0A8H5PVA7_GIBSU|nr:uncharacterized protein FSUBG_7511 [Fusarium subglutinans]KAF5602871.1 hypothetical protein FSUBG_7511 [Fusarium subglutinans]
MAFLELTAPRSSFAESTSTINSEDNKLVALTPPAPAFAELANSTSAEFDVDNTDKVSLQFPISNHELKKPKAFDLIIANLNAMRAKVQALESENKELKSQVKIEKSFKEHFTNSLDEANRNWHSSEVEAATKVQALESENNELKAQIEDEKSSKEQISKTLDEAKRDWHSAELAVIVKVRSLESEINDLKDQVENEKSSKERLSKDLDEVNRNLHSAELEATTKIQVLESENSEFKAQVEYEKSFKQHYSDSLDEVNRNWHNAEFNAAAKNAELCRVRERLSLVEAEAAEQAQLHAVKEQNIQIHAQFRVQFILTTYHHVQVLKHMMHDWKAQVEQKIDEDYEKNKENESDATSLDAEYERLKSLIEGHDYIINNIKKGNEKFVDSIKDIRELENPTPVAELAADRFEAFLHEREKMVAQLESEKQEFVQTVNDNWEFDSQMTDEVAEEMIEIPIDNKEKTKADRKKAKNAAKKAAKKAKKANAKKANAEK